MLLICKNAFIFGLVMVLPLIFMLMRIFQTFSIFYGYCAVFAYAMIAVRIKTPKGRKEITPKRIYVIDDNLICISDKQSESRGVELVKQLMITGSSTSCHFQWERKAEISFAKKICSHKELSKNLKTV